MTKIPFTEEQELEIKTLYETGMSLRKLAIKFSVDRDVVRRIVLEYNCRLRTDASTRKLYRNNNDIFSTTNESDAYWVGFLAADGCLGREGYAIMLTLASKDTNHIEKFKFFLRADNPIYRTDMNVTFRFCDETAYKNLINFGLTPAKSLTLKINDSLIYNRHFWRGFVDGDGSWQRDKKYNNLRFAIKVGSFAIMEQFHIFCKSLGLKTNLNLVCGKYYSITLAKRQSEILAHHLYDDTNISLERKRKIVYREV